MNGIQQWLQLFNNISCYYRNMLMLPLWNRYPNYQTNIWDSLSIFLEGYAFERQGRRPDYSHAAVDSLLNFREQHALNAVSIWNTFRDSLNNQKLNHQNNPLYPSNNPDNVHGISKHLSLVEVAHSNFQSATLSSFIQQTIDQHNDALHAFQFLKTIRGIADKIPSFYLRDLTVVLNMNLEIIQNRALFQPIDTWVDRTVKTLTGDNNLNKKQVTDWIVDNALRHNLIPERINMVWLIPY